MSWLFGVIGNTVRQNSLHRFESVHGEHLYRKSSDGVHYFACGGNLQTCAFEDNSDASSFWVGLGLVVRRGDHQAVLNDRRDWERLVRDRSIAEHHNGHFVLLSHENGRTELRTDPIGLRTLYWCHHGEEIVISTKLHWICEYIGGGEIDHRRIGARWTLFNQLNFESPVKGIRRLGPGGTLVIENGSVTERMVPFTPAEYSNSGTVEEASSLLASFTSPVSNAHGIISLGLSGGLDSRTLLALMVSQQNTAFQTHSFGTLLDPDVFVPRDLTEKEHIPHRVLQASGTASPVTLRMLQSYCAETNLAELVSTAVKLDHLNLMDIKNTLMVDGAFGEIARRQYLNRVEFMGESPFRDGNVERIAVALTVRRGDFFTEEVRRQMKDGAQEEIAWMLASMPKIQEIGFENYLDLWSIRARLPNYSSDEQARLDGIITNYMPFVQYDFAQKVFTLPLHLRRNAKLFRTIIRTYAPGLTRYPLVKSGTTYPFSFNKKSSLIYAKIKSALGYRYTENHLDPFLSGLKNDIMDLILSQQVKEHPSYDHQRIRTSVESYYRGDISQRNNVLWWLTYELWRRSIERK
ncbi:MAG: hypothetical protein ACOYNS_01665 [Bacteroidota bacterium]